MTETTGTNTRGICPKCRQELPWFALNTDTMSLCTQCGSAIRACVFPALLHTHQPDPDLPVPVAEGDASCFHHAGRKAVAACEECGRFLCALCRINRMGRNVCAACLSRQKHDGALPNLTTERILYQQIAWTLTLLPLLVFPFLAITAPIAFGYTIHAIRQPPGILPQRRWPMILAALLALAEFALGLWIIHLMLDDMA